MIICYVISMCLIVVIYEFIDFGCLVLYIFDELWVWFELNEI